MPFSFARFCISAWFASASFWRSSGVFALRILSCNAVRSSGVMSCCAPIGPAEPPCIMAGPMPRHHPGTHAAAHRARMSERRRRDAEAKRRRDGGCDYVRTFHDRFLFE